jgi:type IV pilus assembly protein PilA
MQVWQSKQARRASAALVVHVCHRPQRSEGSLFAFDFSPPRRARQRHKVRAFVNQSDIFRRRKNRRCAMFCRNCGMANPDSGQYCSKCGQPLPAAGARTTPGPTPVPGSSFATPPPVAGDAPTSGKAIASLICGIFTFFLPASIAAIILGHLSLSEIRKSAGRIGGQGIAITGLILGYLGIVIIPFILIIAAIAIPNLLRARMAASEGASGGSLRTINTGAAAYAATWGNGFPSSLEALGGEPGAGPNCNHAALIDPILASGRKSGYIYTYIPHFPDRATAPVISPKAAANGCTSGGASGYTVTADPIQRGTTGQRSFFTDQSGIIRVSNNGESATADSPPLQ